MIQAILAGEFGEAASRSTSSAASSAEPLAPETIEQLQAPFPRRQLPHETLASSREPNHHIAQYVLTRALVERRLAEVLGPAGYQDAYEVLSSDPPAVACHLAIQGIVRTGAGEGATFGEAYDDALVAAARRFGVGWQLEQLGPFWTKLAITPEDHQDGVPEQLAEDAPPSTFRGQRGT